MEYGEVGGEGCMHAHIPHTAWTLPVVWVCFSSLHYLNSCNTHTHVHMHACMNADEGVIVEVTQIILSGIRLFGLCGCDSWHHLHALHGKLASSVADFAIVEQSSSASCWQKCGVCVCVLVCEQSNECEQSNDFLVVLLSSQFQRYRPPSGHPPSDVPLLTLKLSVLHPILRP